MNSILSEHFTKALLILLDETFDNVQGYYLDKNTSLFETLAEITADEASVTVGGKCATLAAQVKHVAFYLDVLEKSILDLDFPKADWEEVWRTVDKVSAKEWEFLREELRTNYNNLLNLIKSAPEWTGEDEICSMVAVVAHTAYHLGEIRQALCVIRP